MKRLIKPIFLQLVLSITIILAVFVVLAADPAARTIVVFETEGENVTKTKGAEKVYPAKAGQRLADGYTAATGFDSFCYLKARRGFNHKA